MKDKIQNIINFLLKYGFIIIAVILGIIGILSIFITAYFDCTFYHPAEKTYFKYSTGIIEITISIFVILLITILNKKILKKIPSLIMLIFILITCIIIFITWINTMRLNPETDQKLIHEMAIGILKGYADYFTGTAQYLFLYPYQFGLALLVSVIYKIFGENFIFVEYLNAICSIANLALIYYISKILFKKESIQKILTFLLCGFSIYWMFFNVHFYGNIIGLTLALTSILFTLLYLETHKFYKLIFSGIFISLSILIKTNYNIFLCGIIIVLVVDILSNPKLKHCFFVLFFLIGYLCIQLCYSLIVNLGINIKLPEGVPFISFVYMGMAESKDLSSGWYTGDTVEIYKNSNYNYEEAKKQSVEKIQTRIQYFKENPSQFIKFYSEKIGSTWLNPTFQTVWCSLPGMRYRWYEDYANYISYHQKALSMVGGNLFKIEEFCFKIYQITIFITSSVGIFKLRKNVNSQKLLLPLIFFGGFLFHIIWETKAIYVIQYYFILLPFSSYGLDYIGEKISIFYNNIKNKKHT